MAGAHQIWRLDLAAGEIHPHAGSGAEEIHDAPLAEAALAQPTGLTIANGRIWFADSETSAVRWADLDPGGRVGTIVGTGLFDFGDRDDTGDEARLQHCLGVAWLDGALFVADSYNGKVKRVDPATRSCVTWAGGTRRSDGGGDADGPASRRETRSAARMDCRLSTSPAGSRLAPAPSGWPTPATTGSSVTIRRRRTERSWRSWGRADLLARDARQPLRGGARLLHHLDICGRRKTLSRCRTVATPPNPPPSTTMRMFPPE